MSYVEKQKGMGKLTGTLRELKVVSSSLLVVNESSYKGLANNGGSTGIPEDSVTFFW